MDTFVQINVDWLLIVRITIALVWGVLYALFLQLNRHGQFLADKRTWLATTIGVGGDLIIAYNGAWIDVCLVIIFSAAPIVVRAMVNEKHAEAKVKMSYRSVWSIEEAIAVLPLAVKELNKSLTNGNVDAGSVAHISKALVHVNGGLFHVKNARKGEYEAKQ